jgi:hypothetical protein
MISEFILLLKAELNLNTQTQKNPKQSNGKSEHFLTFST